MTRIHGIWANSDSRRARKLALATSFAVGSCIALAGSPAYAQKAKPKKPAATAKAPAKAPDEKQQLADAKKHYGDGDTKFKAADYAGALVEFQAADAIKATPQAARYIGLCQDNLGHFQDAVTAYERFLANVPPKMAAQGEAIRSRVEAIRQLPGKVHVDSDPRGASVALDGRPQPQGTPTDLEVSPGHHTLHFTASGRDPLDKGVDVTFASRQDLSVTLPVSTAPPPAPVAVIAPLPDAPPPAPPPDAPPPTSSGHTITTGVWVTGGLAVVAAGVGTTFGILTLNAKSSYDDHPTSSGADDGKHKALATDISFGAAIVLGVTSLALYFSSSGHHDDAPPPAAASDRTLRSASAGRASSIRVMATPIVTAHGGGAGALITF
jgi:hypothetical protein